MSQELATLNPEILSSLILNGNIAKLNPTQRVQYVTSLCERLGLDPLTQPFKILSLQGKEVLYADKGCTQQLCKIYGISTEITKKEKIEDVYVVSVRASDKDGRYTDDDGAVTVGASKGDVLANALMKAVTKAKRRSVLAFCGLGMLDESEIETIPNAQVIDIPKPQVVLPPQDSNKHLVEEKNAAFIKPEDEKVTGEQGQALLNYLKLHGYTKDDLKQYIGDTWGLNSLMEVCNKHLLKIKEHFSKPKDVVAEKLGGHDANFANRK